MNAWKPVTDEPVRGTPFPPWLLSLPGSERVRLMGSGLISPTPLARLFGVRIGHVSPGTVIATMPASGNFIALPAMDIAPLIIGALRLAATTAIPAGYDVTPMTVSLHYFRYGRPRPGNLLARARTLNASSLFVTADVEVEDPEGRQLGHAVSQWAINPVDPPPAPPDPIEPGEEPTFATPDPPDRAAASLSISTDLLTHKTGLEVAEMLVAGDLAPLPIQYLLGARWLGLSNGELSQAMPASPWFRSDSQDDVSEAVLGPFLNQVLCVRMLAELGKTQLAAALEGTYRFLAAVPADGRELQARARLSHSSGNIRFLDAEIVDSEGRVVASAGSAWGIIDRPDRRQVEQNRVLTTLLFTDIVGSTGRAQQIGDNAWRALLGEHNGLVRRELTAHRGHEIKATGDGFLARFDSPAAAVRCAKAIRDGVRRLNLEVRAGVHTGECEVNGSDLAGITVHVAARIMDEAGPSEIVVSQTVRDLSAGSELFFAPRGPRTLQGVEGEWNLFTADDGVH